MGKALIMLNLDETLGSHALESDSLIFRWSVSTLSFITQRDAAMFGGRTQLLLFGGN